MLKYCVTRTSSRNLQPTLSSLDVNGESLDLYGSMSSIASSFVTMRKKKIAPPPPGSFNDSDHSSITSSPTPSAPHSPRMTPRSRKTKKAPLPPTASSSTPFSHSKVSEYFESNVSPLSEKDYHLPPPEIRIGDYETEKTNKDKENRNRQSQIYDTSTNTPTITDKSTHGKWKRRKGPAPARPIPQRRQIKPLPVAEIRRELDFIEIQQQGLERQGVRLEQIIREKCEGPNSDPEGSMSPEVEELILQLFELVNEKNELFRKQAELMYLRRQQRLEEEYADLEYQIRCLMLKPEMNQTDSDKAKKEEELINRLLEVVERRNEIVECLEMDRIREAEEDTSITNQMTLYTSKVKDEVVPLNVEDNKKQWKQKIKKKLKLSKSPKVDADKDIDESELSSNSLPSSKKEKKKKFNLF
ncbi:MICAL-like protein 1 [Agrilus planipennis]|uniref:MICAL-like protein 1 n=1 Tax=Agrilus planipennis TaxID=224129 RepID=A0A7F5R7P4_AGRPL|nr:MICAL-like protein 1 [Agrilus planipennis]